MDARRAAINAAGTLNPEPMGAGPERSPVFGVDEKAEVLDIFCSDCACNIQSPGGQDDIGIERFGVGRWGASIPSRGPQFGGFQHYIGVNRKIVQDGLETIKPVHAFMETSADKLAAYFVIRDLREVNNRTFP